MNKQIIVFDGIKLCRVHAGMHRYMVECLRELDKLVKDKPFRLELVYPAFYKIQCPKFQHIAVKKIWHLSPADVKTYGKRAAVFTTQEQWWDKVLPRYVQKKNAIFCGMMNDNPMGKTNIICLHDTLLTKPEAEYPQELMDAYLKKFKLLKQHCRYLMTVSNTSRRDISQELDFPEDRIFVTYNGWEHMQRINADNNTAEKFPQLRPKNYYYALGTLTPHKNYKWVVEVARRNPDCVFAVAGKIGVSSLKDEWKLPNLHYLGRVSDGENKWLMEHCKAFLHPSLLEGFGIPPLEALSCGAPIIISNASCLPEIYGDAAHYFDPYKYDYRLDELLQQPVAPAETLLKKYSWKDSAKKWLEIIETVLNEGELVNE